MAFRIERNDITKVHTDAIVNTANPLPIVGSGTDEAVYSAAGTDKLLEARKKIGKIEPGHAVATPSFNLENAAGIKYIIHTIGIMWKGGNQGEIQVMRNCYKNSLNLAKELSCKSISIPLLATGNYGFPKDIALNIALDEISKFLFEVEMEVVLIVYDDESFAVSNKIFEDVQSFISENYINEKDEEIHRADNMAPGLKTNLSLNSLDDKILKKAQNKEPKKTGKSLTIEEYMSQNTNGLNFQELIKMYISEKGLDNPTVYKKSIIVDKKLFSKIINGHIPNKHSVMALGLALELDLESFQIFLATANFAFNPADKFDTVVKYCVIQKIFNVMDVDSLLFQLGIPCFNNS